MTDMKPLASLSGNLLARKGGARPAMRPQFQRTEADPAAADGALDDLGWNDMGDEDRGAADILPLTPAPRTQDETARIRAADAAASRALAANAHSWIDEANAPPPAEPEVRRQRDQLATALEAPVIAPAEPEPQGGAAEEPPMKTAPAPALIANTGRRPRRGSALERGGRAAFTLRLDADRHLKLRLAATVRHQSAQAIVTAALDQFLGTMPELDTLAAQVKRP